MRRKYIPSTMNKEKLNLIIILIAWVFFLTIYMIIFSSLNRAQTYWFIAPSWTSVIFLVYFYVLREDEILKLLKHSLKNKILWFVFFVLLIVYIFLYHLVPSYIMKMVDSKNRETLLNSISLIVGNSTNDVEKALRIYNWVENSSGLTNVYADRYNIDHYIYFISKPPFVCLRLGNKNYPLWVLTSKCGACEEYSLLFREIANMANLTVRSIHNPGEDHNWDEVLVNGSWIIVDPGWPIFNPPPSFYEMNRSINGSNGLNVSYVYGVYPNGTIIDLTERYTNVSLLKISVVDENNNPLEGVILRFDSFNLLENGKEISNLECATDKDGTCKLKLGGGSYRVKVFVGNKIFGYGNETKFYLNEEELKEIRIVIKRSLPNIRLSPRTEEVILELVIIIIGFSLLWSYFVIISVESFLLHKFLKGIVDRKIL